MTIHRMFPAAVGVVAAAFAATLFGCADAGGLDRGGADPGAGAERSEALLPLPEQAPFQCAGFGNVACPGGGGGEASYLCADDWRDDCDPSAGGADCPGLCLTETVRYCGGPLDPPCGAEEVCVPDPSVLCVPPADGPPSCSVGVCALADPAGDCGPMPPCAAPPPGCNYEGGGCVNGSWTCGTLVCDCSEFPPPPPVEGPPSDEDPPCHG